jgi:hypothetical protein
VSSGFQSAAQQDSFIKKLNLQEHKVNNILKRGVIDYLQIVLKY